LLSHCSAHSVRHTGGPQTHLHCGQSPCSQRIVGHTIAHFGGSHACRQVAKLMGEHAVSHCGGAHSGSHTSSQSGFPQLHQHLGWQSPAAPPGIGPGWFSYCGGLAGAIIGSVPKRPEVALRAEVLPAMWRLGCAPFTILSRARSFNRNGANLGCRSAGTGGGADASDASDASLLVRRIREEASEATPSRSAAPDNTRRRSASFIGLHEWGLPAVNA